MHLGSRTRALCVVALLAAVAGLSEPCQRPGPEKLSIVVFSPPSLGAFLPPVIKAQKLDEKNGLAINFEERTPDAYTAQFNSGEFKLGGSASLLTVGLADIRGVKVDVPVQPVRLLGRRRHLAAGGQDAEGPRRQGSRRRARHHQLPDVRLVRPPARRRPVEILGGQYRDARPGRLRAGRSRRRGPALGAGLHAAARQEAEHAHARPADRRSWKAFAGSRNIPYLGVAAHIDWAEKNRDAGAEALRDLQGRPRNGSRRIPTRPRS